MLSTIQLRYCYENFWDGKAALPLRIAAHPYAVYGPGAVLDSRWSNPQAAAMMNAERFRNRGQVVSEDVLGNQARLDIQMEPETFKQRRHYHNAIS